MQTPDQPFPGVNRSPPLAGTLVASSDVRARIQEGWRCVRFEHCLSFLFVTVRRQSGVYLTENWRERYLRGMGYSVLSLLLGPWGVPWGLVWTVRAVWTNLTGGVDVTDDILAQLEGRTYVPCGPL
ncbi:MAG: hypothetical protein JWO38_1075 [Gemmataceae bacterium]|nr:hypothetical protein [Gemmataceae bacterium]